MIMTERKRLSVHYLIRGILLGGVTFYVTHLVSVDHLQYYIAPRMIGYVKYAAMAMYLLAAYFIYAAIQQAFGEGEIEECDCDHTPSKSVWRNVILYGLFAIPPLLGFLLPDSIMESDIAAVKGMNLDVAKLQVRTTTASLKQVQKPAASSPPLSSKSPKPQANPKPQSSSSTTEEAKLKKLFPADEYTEDYAKLGMVLYKKELIKVTDVGFFDILTDMDLYKDSFQGKKIDISGFVYRESDMKPNQFVISRMAVTCCSADATPYGLLVETDLGKTLKKDTWIHLQGVVGHTVYHGNTIIRLSTTSIVKIKPPKDPYVYSYFGNLTDLAK